MKARPRKRGDDSRASSLERVEIPGATQLHEIRDGHSIWEGAPAPILKGAVIKLHPPESATDEAVKRAKEALLAGGATDVRVVPRRKSSEPLPAVSVESVGIRARDARKVVDRVFLELRHPDAPAVRAELEAAMGAEGL